MADLFRMSQHQGIYHTLSLWYRLSPKISRGEKPEADAKNQDEELKQVEKSVPANLKKEN